MEPTSTCKVIPVTQKENQASFSYWKPFHQQINNLAYTESWQELFNQALDLVIQITSADSAAYFLLDPESKDLVITAIRGDDSSQHLIGMHIPKQEALLQTGMDKNEPIVIGDLHEDPRWLRYANPTSAARMARLISLPIVAKDHGVGVIQIYNYREADLDKLEVIRERIAIEVEHRTRIEESRQSNSQLKTLIQALGQIGGTLDRKQMLQTILEQAASLVQAERTSIYITAPEKNDASIQLTYQPGPDQDLDNQTPLLHSLNYNTTNSPGENRSIVSVPLRSGSARADDNSNSRQYGALMAIKPHHASFSDEDNNVLNILVQQASVFFQAAEIFESMEELFFDVIGSLVASLDAKDPYTQGHSKRVSEYSVLIAQKLNLDDNDLHNIRIGSLLHDVGKIGIPDEILKKNGKLTADEYAIIRGHPLTGWKILRGVRLLEPMLPAILEHHEKLDGSGYPYGLCQNQISMMGRIVAVSDVFDAMTSDRPYRSANPVPDVLKYLEENSGILFDRFCVNELKEIVLAGNQL